MHGELATWLRDATPARGLRPKAAAIVDFLVSQPQQAAYASVADVARRVGANPATVTRTAQALGYGGWPDLQRELRARYLSHLSAAQVNAAHREEGGTSWAGSLSRDQENLAQLAAHADDEAVARIARAIASARRTLVIAAGSYASAGTALAHNARLAGYDVRLEATGGADLVNSVAALGPEDLLIAISFWRLYQSTVTAAEDASERGTRVFVITDAASPHSPPRRRTSYWPPPKARPSSPPHGGPGPVPVHRRPTRHPRPRPHGHVGRGGGGTLGAVRGAAPGGDTEVGRGALANGEGWWLRALRHRTMVAAGAVGVVSVWHSTSVPEQFAC